MPSHRCPSKIPAKKEKVDDHVRSQVLKCIATNSESAEKNKFDYATKNYIVKFSQNNICIKVIYA